MSFILDALKKSESDRQRQTGPSLFEVKVAPPRRKLPVWAVAIAVLLAINLIVISWMLLRHPSAPAPTAALSESPPSATAPVVARAAPATAPVATPSGSAAAPVGAPSGGGTAPLPAPSGREAAPVTASSASAGAPVPTPGEARPPVTASAAATPTDGRADQPTAPPAGNPSDYAPAVEPARSQGAAASADTGSTSGLAIYQQIVNSANLPSLHLDLHVYADRPQDRFAMINMHRVVEGDSLPNGVQVDAIRPDGVALSYHGTRFLLPRN